MLFRKRKESRLVCPKVGKGPGRFRKYPWLIWLFPVVGLASLIWFLIRVVPKPSRATYPCQRVAFPLASGFIIWLFGLAGCTVAFRKARRAFSRSRYLIAVLCVMVSIGCAWLTLTLTAEKPLKAVEPHPVNDPIGVAKGIHPGRVVWVHDPNATDWEGPASGDGYWWQSDNTDQAVVDEMMSKAIRLLAGQANEEAAWDAIFRYFNQSRGREDVGYQSGEKITIKANMVAVSTVDAAGNQAAHLYRVNTSPQMILALLWQLVNVVGVAESDITVGDTTQYFPNHYWDYCHTEFPYVHYLAKDGSWSRRGAVSSEGQDCEVPFYWSTPGANGKTQDYLPVSYAEATYLINFACLKGHSSGVTLCAKNHYGSFIRLPPATGYYNLHLSLPNPGWSPGTGHYRAHVDITGHPHLGGKTLLYLIDGLYGGYYWEAYPYKWNTEPFGGDWPSSLFASQDPVAIDSVAYDFLLQEWPDVVTGGTGAPGSLEGGAHDYLHEAALAHDPPSGTFYDPNNDGVGLASLGVHEHWNNPIDKQYSRNLGTGNGIELVQGEPAPDVDFSGDGRVDFKDLSILAQYWWQVESSVDIAPLPLGDGIVNLSDIAVFAEYWLAEIPKIGLVAHWKLDETEGGIAYDSIGDNDATLHGPEWTDGKINGALHFDGFNAYLDCGDSEVLGPEQMTLAMWLEPGHMGGMRYIVSRAGSSDDIDYAVMRHLTGEVEFAVGQLGSDPVSVLSTDTTPLGEWSHVAVCLDGSQASVYIDGQPDGSANYGVRVARAGHRLMISSLRAITRFYFGKIDDVRIYNVALGAEDIAALAD